MSRDFTVDRLYRAIHVRMRSCTDLTRLDRMIRFRSSWRVGSTDALETRNAPQVAVVALKTPLRNMYDCGRVWLLIRAVGAGRLILFKVVHRLHSAAARRQYLGVMYQRLESPPLARLRIWIARKRRRRLRLFLDIWFWGPDNAPICLLTQPPLLPILLPPTLAGVLYRCRITCWALAP
jgi:hypothetical protein